MSFSEEAPFPTLSLTLDKLQTSNVWKSPSQNKYTSSSQDHFPIAITSSHKHYYAPCSAYLDRAPGTTLPRAAGSSSSGGYQDRGSQDSTFPPQCYSCWAWAGGAGTRLTVLAESRVHWLGSRVAQGKGYAGTLHTALTVHLLCPGHMGYHMQGTLGMISSALQVLWHWYFLGVPDLAGIHCTVHLQHHQALCFQSIR